MKNNKTEKTLKEISNIVNQNIILAQEGLDAAKQRYLRQVIISKNYEIELKYKKQKSDLYVLGICASSILNDEESANMYLNKFLDLLN
jgi:hypothetical protein